MPSARCRLTWRPVVSPGRHSDLQPRSCSSECMSPRHEEWKGRKPRLLLTLLTCRSLRRFSQTSGQVALHRWLCYRLWFQLLTKVCQGKSLRFKLSYNFCPLPVTPLHIKSTRKSRLRLITTEMKETDAFPPPSWQPNLSLVRENLQGDVRFFLDKSESCESILRDGVWLQNSLLALR